MPNPMPPIYNRSLYDERQLYRNPYGGYYSYSTILDDSSRITEALIVVLAFSLWFYSLYRLYSAWQNTLNFSEASIQGPQGWDLLVNWIAERIRIRNLKVYLLLWQDDYRTGKFVPLFKKMLNTSHNF